MKRHSADIELLLHAGRLAVAVQRFVRPLPRSKRESACIDGTSLDAMVKALDEYDRAAIASAKR